ncbi:hypothetical protein PY257_03890 [Ramlibacter sp. H39-3-26]|uniref:hypothetical protein n=1 Tax=Curvibacter soli TaxID=3031331 RepID=UPI0023DC8A37|nr:hypothetical protein [Ramlibacter sp. H39-3-26]MDF1484327.1 hypothetical protein [Ramlibacter sp. H39-3-26]
MDFVLIGLALLALGGFVLWMQAMVGALLALIFLPAEDHVPCIQDDETPRGSVARGCLGGLLLLAVALAFWEIGGGGDDS